MKLIDNLKFYSKWSVYELYQKIVYNTRDYEKITKKKMIEEIIKQYQEEGYFYLICTNEELDLLRIKSLADNFDYVYERVKNNKKLIYESDYVY